MLEVEKFPCSNKTESDVRERYWLELLNANMNMQIPNRNIKEWRSNNKEQLKAKKKAYYETNKETFNENNIQHRLKHKAKCECICGSKYSAINKSQHRKTQKHLLHIISTLSTDPNILDV